MEHSNIPSVAIEHFQGELEVFPLITIRYEESLGRAVVATIQVELLHVQIRVSDPNKCTEL